jgi:hypothetical protein
MFIRLYRKKKLIVTLPVDEVHADLYEPRYYDSYNTGMRISAKSEFIARKLGMVHDGYIGIAFVNNYGNWRLTQGMEKLIGARTGVTFTKLEVL